MKVGESSEIPHAGMSGANERSIAASRSGAAKSPSSPTRPPRVVSPTDLASVVRIAPPSEQQPCVTRSAGSWTSLQFRVQQAESMIPGHLYDAASVEYELDAVYDWQEDFYNSVVRPVVEQSLQGYHGSIIALGARGTGKKHSLSGPIVRAAKKVFHCLGLAKASARGLVVIVSKLAVYHEVMYDLLGQDSATAASDSSSLPVVTTDGDGLLEGLSEHVVSSADDVEKLLHQGVQEESKLFTHGIHGSSHVVFTITVEHRGKGSKLFPVCGMLRFVEVADWTPVAYSAALHGSDSSASAQDKSLIAFLQTLITASRQSSLSSEAGTTTEPSSTEGLESKPQLISLLPGCIGGNSKTVLVWNVSPNSQDSHISQHVLATAAQCKSIRNDPDKKDLLEKAWMNVYIRDLRQKNRKLVVVKGSKESVAALSSEKSEKDRPKTSKNTRRKGHGSRADDVVWDPTQAGQLPAFQEPTRIKEQQFNNWVADAAKKPQPDGDSTYDMYDDISQSGDQRHGGGASNGDTSGSENSGDEYTFDSVPDSLWSPSKVDEITAEEAADALAAVATADYQDEDEDEDAGSGAGQSAAGPVPGAHEKNLEMSEDVDRHHVLPAQEVHRQLEADAADSSEKVDADTKLASMGLRAAAEYDKGSISIGTPATVYLGVATGRYEDPTDTSLENIRQASTEKNQEESNSLSGSALATITPKDSMECLETSQSSLGHREAADVSVESETAEASPSNDQSKEVQDVKPASPPAQPGKSSLLKRLKSAKVRPMGSAPSGTKSKEENNSLSRGTSAVSATDDSLHCLEVSQSSLGHCDATVATAASETSKAIPASNQSQDTPEVKLASQPAQPGKPSLLKRLKSAKVRPTVSAQSASSHESSKSTETASSEHPQLPPVVASQENTSDTASRTAVHVPHSAGDTTSESNAKRGERRNTFFRQQALKPVPRPRMHVSKAIAILSGDEKHCTSEMLLELLEVLQHAINATEDARGTTQGKSASSAANLLLSLLLSPLPLLLLVW